MKNPTKTTRRGFLSTAAALAVTAPAILPALATAADPIFAVIEAHRQAYVACVAVDGNIPDDLADVCGDAWHLVMQTHATTPAGLVALTTWLREEAAELNQSGSMLFSNDLLTIAATIDDSARGMSGLAPWSPPAAATTAPIDAVSTRYENLLLQYVDAFFAWSSLSRAVRETADMQEREAAWESSGHNAASAKSSAISDEMEPLADAIKAAAGNTIASLRAKALVVLYEAMPHAADHAGLISVSDYDGGAADALFLAVAEFTGLLPLVRDIETRLAADATVEGDDAVSS